MTTGTTQLILCVHGHQPAGNFGWVFGEAYAKAYRPFFEVIARHPAIRWTVHLSGPLLEWLEREHPEMVRQLAELVRRGQVEMLGGGYAEPILCLLPARDAVGQIRRMTRQLERLRLGPCRGAWLTERVWEPSLPRLLRAAGIEYTVVDDHHLMLAGLGDQAAVGYWVTEDAGQTVALFPSSKALRYLVPFKPVDQVLAHLEAQRGAEGRAVILGDDLEKFGLWPGTSRWVYEEGWLERFCQALEAASAWLKTSTFSQFLGAYPPLGRAYVPCASYPEMLEWSGGHFRNFLTKYPEANTMYQKMLWVSQQAESGRGRLKGQAARALETALYRGQGNDAYWHGVFGGIYLHHLRTATYRELLTAERILDGATHGARPWSTAEELDLDGDGQPEVLLRSALMDVCVDPQEGGAIVEWDDKARAINLVNTMTRRPEPYHATLGAPEPVAVGAAAVGDAPETLHTDHRATPPGLQEHLVYDRYRRVAAIDHLWAAGTGGAQAFARGEIPEWGELVGQPYRWRVDRRPDGVRAILSREISLEGDGRRTVLKLTKTVSVSRRRPEVQVTYTVLNMSGAPRPLRLGSEWNLALKDPHFNRIGELRGATRLVVTDRHQDVGVEMTATQPAAGWYFPSETVSDSDRGFERTYQHLCLALWWDLVAAPRRPWRVALTQTVRPGGVHASV